MRWSRSELIYELNADRARRVLFVEGFRDLSFWRDIVLTRGRTDGVVYPISTLESPRVLGGERGRLIACAGEFLGSTVEDRVRFFADADSDRLLCKDTFQNVILTDGRDLESYGLSEPCLGRLIGIGFPSSNRRTSELIHLIELIVRPIGILRTTSERHNLNLPFKRTLEHRGLDRFVVKRGQELALDIDVLTRTLIQNAGLSLNVQSDIRAKHIAEEKTCSDNADHQVVHGKDFLMFLAMWFDVSVVEIERLLFMSMAYDVEVIRQHENISAMQDWLMGVTDVDPEQ